MSLILWGNEMATSPYVLSCFVTLREKQIPFELRAISLQRRAHQAPPFVQLSLTSRVPVLVDGDLALSESSAIVEYLEEKFPPPGHARVLPVDTIHRARARQVMAWVRSDVMALREERPTDYVFGAPTVSGQPPPLSEAGRRAADKVVGIATALIPEGGGPLFDAWCIADTDLAMMLWRLSRTGYPLPPKVRAFADREWERPAVREFAALPRPASTSD